MLTVHNVSKLYRLYDRPSGRLLEAVSLNRFGRHTDVWALRDVSLSIERGETPGIVGDFSHRSWLS